MNKLALFILLLPFIHSYDYTDLDSDGVPDESDNCVSIPNPDQLDTDADGDGDACDTDDDDDGVLDLLDDCPVEAGYETYAGCPDTTSPSIDSISANDTIIRTGGAIMISVEASDEIGLYSVTANDVLLTPDGGIWAGAIEANSLPIRITAKDTSNNTIDANFSSILFDDTMPIIEAVFIMPQLSREGTEMNISFDYIEENLKEAEVMIENRTATRISDNGTHQEYAYTVSGSEREGMNTVLVRLTDEAGNTATESSNAEIDLMPRIASCNLSRDIVRTNDLVEITLVVIESHLADAAADNVLLSCSGGVCAGLVTITKPSIDIKITDLGNNTLEHEYSDYTIDDIPPEITPVSARTFPYNGSFSIDIDANDNTGLSRWEVNDTIHFTIDDNGVLRYVSPLSYGQYSLNISVFDIAGNPDWTSLLLRITDPYQPITADNAPSGEQPHPVTVTLTAADPGSGIAYTSYHVNSNPWTNGTSISLGNNGQYTIYYFSVDLAGNFEDTKQASFSIQKSTSSGKKKSRKSGGSGIIIPSTQSSSLKSTKIIDPATAREDIHLFFNNTQIPIRKIFIDINANMVESTSLSLEKIGNLSAPPDHLASGYVKIDTKNFNIKKEKIDEINIEFIADDNWISANNIGESSIGAYKLIGSDWVKQETIARGYGKEDYFITIKSEGFSVFGIFGKVSTPAQKSTPAATPEKAAQIPTPEPTLAQKAKTPTPTPTANLITGAAITPPTEPKSLLRFSLIAMSLVLVILLIKRIQSV